ncbi:MAG: hypothetical protein L6Q54_07225 [Leptospiraceae bacterium]|nr:hypothetical protein [Leptospiraceae bacterium]MCK6381027.1 hypothetical protein [Leptospiraceae bacterium]NUM41433.1 hypothetical protein [Leptospiraceae bacterium]
MQKRLLFFCGIFFFFIQEIISIDSNFKKFIELIQSKNSFLGNNENLFQNKQIQVPKNCQFRLQKKIETANYFYLDCGDRQYRNFLYFGQYENQGEIISFQFTKNEKIGTREYSIVTKLQIQKNPEKQISKNSNLYSFIQGVIKKDSLLLENLKNQYIYFDKDCPLEFAYKDSDFHWEKIDMYNFRISCLEPENSFVVSLKMMKDRGEFIGKQLLKQGKLIHVRLKFDSISDLGIHWKNFETIP